MERKGSWSSAAVRGSRAVAVLVLTLGGIGCGSQQSRAEIEAAARGSLGTGGSGAEVGFGPAEGSNDEALGDVGDVADTAGGTTRGSTAPGNRSDPGGRSAGNQSAGGSANDGGGGGGEGGASGEPIVIGNVSTTSGISGPPQVPGVRALQAWVAMTNAAGGINGHPIKLVLADDGADPARHASAVKDLVENQGAIAFVANWASQTIQASVPYLEEKGIPVIGGDGSTSTWFESPMLFAQGPTPENFMRARLKALASATDGRKLATMVCREAAVCQEFASSVKRHASEFGFKVVYEGVASLAQPDFTAECISARNAGAETVLPVFDASGIRRIGQSCDRQGYRPHYDLVGAIEPDFVEVPFFDGATVSHWAFPGVANHPAAAEFRDALRRYVPNQPPMPVASSGWAAGELFGKVAAAAFPPETTPSTGPLLEALWSIQNDTVSGTMGPLTYKRNQPVGPTAPRCVFVVRIQAGKLVAPNGMDPTCL